MSGSMEKLISALEANTAAINKMIEMSGGKAAAGGAKAAESPKADPKPAGGKPAGNKAAGGGKKKTTVDDIAAAFGGYLGIKDKDERETRKANVKAINEYFGVAKATDLDPDNFDEALGYLQQYIDGEEPDFSGGGEGEGEGEGDLV